MIILTFFAHPDDETMLCGGTLALLAKHGAEIHYLCATRGEGGEYGDPPVCTQEELGSVRQQELACAVEALGGKRLHLLDYVDPVVGENNQLFPYTDDIDELVRTVLQHVNSLKPDVLITHGSNGEYGHPAHLLTYQAACQVIALLGDKAPLHYTIQADFTGHPKPHLANKRDPAHLVLDVSPVMDEKTRAALCHRTQHNLFIRNTSLRLGRQVSVAETLLNLESLHRAYPPVHSQVDDALARLLYSTGAIQSL